MIQAVLKSEIKLFFNMLRITDSSHNFTFNNYSSQHFRDSNSIPYLNEHLLMSELFYLDDNNSTPKINNEISLIDNENPDLLKDLEDSNENIKSKEKLIKWDKDDSNHINYKKYIQAIQSKVKEKIYLKRPFKEKKILGRKKKHNEGLGEHNKFSDDNILRKCKNVILDCILNYINDKIKLLYSNEKAILLKEKKLFKLKQNQKIRSRTNYNKIFLNKTLKEIFSENISTKYSRYSPSHNKDLIEFLINEKDEVKKAIFNKIFNLAFLDCIKHFRGSVLLDELQGMNQLNEYIKERKINKDDEEYFIILEYFINNFENIVMEKKARNRRSKNNI